MTCTASPRPLHFLHPLTGAKRSPDYITIEEAAEILGYHVKSVRRMVRRGTLWADKKMAIWLIRRDAIEAYAEAVKGKAKNDPRRGA
jgi:excisionase family DNA binding protein